MKKKKFLRTSEEIQEKKKREKNLTQEIDATTDQTLTGGRANEPTTTTKGKEKQTTEPVRHEWGTPVSGISL